MGKLLKIALGLMLFIVIIIGVFLYEFTRYDESSLSSHYGYTISLTTDSKLEKPIFYVPIPVLGNDITMANMAINENARVSDDWNLSIIETEYGKMLKISTKEFVPGVKKLVELQPPVPGQTGDIPTGNSSSFTMGDKYLSVSMVADHVIDTKNATENEPLLSQKFNLTPSSYKYPSNGIPLKTQRYDSIIYADYGSSPNATVEVLVSLDGRNEWFAGGWAFNIYRESLGITLTGEKHGWVPASGELVEGEGRYN
ncbi:MAG: hypothetical protein FIB07_01555 [Candidatus Methanoperedens sp.]|nr:hypothetical protein [Candidatus Methanoperedens sp.]